MLNQTEKLMMLIMFGRRERISNKDLFEIEKEGI